MRGPPAVLAGVPAAGGAEMQGAARRPPSRSGRGKTSCRISRLLGEPVMVEVHFLEPVSVDGVVAGAY
jgi:hypothetical protein